MSASYPSAIYSPRTKANKTGVVYNPLLPTVLFAEDVVGDDLEVVAIETELGLNPKGAKASVRARLDDVDSAIGDIVVPVKASGAEIDTGTDDAKFATAKAIADSVLTTPTKTQTHTNKRIKPRIYTTTDISGTPGVLTPEIDTYDYFELTAQAHALNIANHSTSSPQGGENMIIAITPDATPRALTYGTNYVAKGGVALPTTTVASKTLTLGFKYNAGLGKWNLLAVAQEA